MTEGVEDSIENGEGGLLGVSQLLLELRGDLLAIRTLGGSTPSRQIEGGEGGGDGGGEEVGRRRGGEGISILIRWQMPVGGEEVGRRGRRGGN